MLKVEPKWDRYEPYAAKRLSGVRLRTEAAPSMAFGLDTGLKVGSVEVLLDVERSLIGLKNAEGGQLTLTSMRRGQAHAMMAVGILNTLRKGYARDPLPWHIEDGMVIVDCSGLPDAEE